MATMGLSRTVYEINGYFGRNLPIFPSPVAEHLTLTLRGFSWNFAMAFGFKNSGIVPTKGSKSLTICSFVSLQNTTTSRTDGRTDRSGKTISRYACWRMLTRD